MAVKLTKTYIEALQAGVRDMVRWDSEVRGLHLKITPAGKKVFFVYYRAKAAASQQRRFKIGDYGPVTVHQARERAKEVLGVVASGKDPAADRQAARHRLENDRIHDLVEEFLAKHAAQRRSAAETKRIFERDILPRLGTRSVHSLRKRDIVELLGAIAERGSPIMANRTLATIRKFLNWCVSRAILETSPCQGVQAPGKEVKRDRLLTDDELRRVLVAARTIGFPYGTIIELLALTGQRRDEVAGMAWTELDLATASWTIPAARSKNGKPHIVHLASPVLTILSSVDRLGVLAFSTNGRTPFQGFSKCKRQLDALSGITGWTLHDLRRTVVSGMARLGISPHVADKVLNHNSGTISGVAAVYQLHQFLPERRNALNMWGTHVWRLLAEETSGSPSVLAGGCAFRTVRVGAS